MKFTYFFQSLSSIGYCNLDDSACEFTAPFKGSRSGINLSLVIVTLTGCASFWTSSWNPEAAGGRNWSNKRSIFGHCADSPSTSNPTMNMKVEIHLSPDWPRYSWDANFARSVLFHFATYFNAVLLSIVWILDWQCLLQESLEGQQGSGKELRNDELERLVSKVKEATLLDAGQSSVWSTLGLLLLRSGRIQVCLFATTYSTSERENEKSLVLSSSSSSKWFYFKLSWHCHVTELWSWGCPRIWTVDYLLVHLSYLNSTCSSTARRTC